MPVVFLHAQAAGMADGLLATFVYPFIAMMAGVLLVAIVVRAYGWKGGVTAAVAGAACLTAGLTGDLIVHHGQDTTRQELMTRVQMRDPRAADELDQLDHAEEGNPWHFVAAAGEGLIVGGLAGACLVLWLRNRNELSRSGAYALQRGAAFPAGLSGSAADTPPASVRRQPAARPQRASVYRADLRDRLRSRAS